MARLARTKEEALVTPRDGAAAVEPETPARLALGAVEADGVRFTIEGAPDRDWQVVLSPVEGPPMEVFGTTVAIGAHPLVGRCLESQNLRGRTDAAGRASGRLSRAFVAEWAGAPLWAVVAVFPRVAGPDAPPAVSPPVELPP